MPKHFLQLMDNRTIGYTLKGEPFLPEDMGPLRDGYKVPVSSVLLTVPVTRDGVMESDLQQAKEFARKYVVKHLKAHGHEACEEEISRQLDALTVEKINEDLRTKESLGRLHEEDGSHVVEHGNFEKHFKETFAHMPEWLQILAHEHGAYITAKTSDEESAADTKSRTFGAALGDRELPGVLALYIYPNCMKSASLGRRVLREEFLHELQSHAEHFNGLYDESTPVYAKAKPAMLALLKQMDEDPDHCEALQLIKMTSPAGGSVIGGGWKDDAERFDELMIDIYDAEVNLRKKLKNPVKTEQELRRVFSPEIYDLSRQFVKVWMDQAQEVLTKSLEGRLGHEEAIQIAQMRRSAWEKAPFTHQIILTKLPEYKMGSRVLH